MDVIIKDAEKYDLTGEDLHRITRGKCNIMPYHQLQNVNNINEVLGQYGALILLYETKQDVGHWVCLLKNENTLEFFDPYGLNVDEELKFISSQVRRQENETTGHLTDLIMKSGYKTIYNNVRLQKFLKDVNTCGRWVALRIRLRDNPLKLFIKIMTHNKCYDGDFWVSALTLMM